MRKRHPGNPSGGNNGGNNGESSESTRLNPPRRQQQQQQQQYHYLYGSTDSNPNDDDDDHDSHLHLPSSHSPTATDLDSLVGEGLVQTDTEPEDDFLTPNNSEKDFEQLLISNGNGMTVAINGGQWNLPPHHHQQLHDKPSSNTKGSAAVRPPPAPGSEPSSWTSRNGRFRRKHPVLYFAAVVGGLAAVVFVITIVAFPNSRIALLVLPAQDDAMNDFGRHLKVPFPKVDRADYGDPVQSFLATELLDPAFFSRSPTETREFVFPFPTGAFWTNLVLPPTADRGLSYPVAVYPYAYKWSDQLLQVSYPARHRVEEEKAIHDYFFPDLTLSVLEETQRRHVTYFDPLSVTLRWYYDNGGTSETYLVQGSPYVTVKYNNASPTIRAFSLFKGFVCPHEDSKSQAEMMKGDTSQDDPRERIRKQRRRKLSFGICESVPDESGKAVYLRGVQFVLQTQEGMNWLLFASEPIEFIFDTQVRTTVAATSSFRGLLRLALMPSGTSPSSSESTTSSSSAPAEPYNASASQIAASTGLQRLIYHAGVYPVRGDFSWSVRSSEAAAAESALKSAAKSISGVMSLAAGNMVGSSRDSTLAAASTSASRTAQSTTTSLDSDRIATITFQFATETFSPPSSGSAQKSLLMLALPHHAMSLPTSIQLGADQFDLQYLCIKGPMRPVLGSTWSYDEPLPPIGFEVVDDAQRERVRQQSLGNSVVRSAIIESLREDIELALPTLDENVYGFGKQSARLAQLAHIIHELRLTLDSTNSTDSAAPDGEEGLSGSSSDLEVLNDLFDNAIGSLRPALEHFLTNGVSDYLVFDSNLGGIVTINGLRSKDSDFGNGRYNDHHFHYGYLLYACAIMGKVDPTFVQSFGTAVDSIYFDVASDANFVSQKAKGVFFPASRHKSWFDGHSFASGLFPFGNGKSQESSSEAVNCYYGALLWSLVRHGAAHDPSSDVSYQTDFTRILLSTEIRGAQLYWHMHPPVQGNKSDTLKVPVYSTSFAKNYMVGNLGMLDAVASTWFGTESLYVHMINEIPVTAVTEQLFSRPYVQQEYENVLKPLGEVQMAWQGYLVCNLAIIDSRAAWDKAVKLFSPELDSALSKSQVLYWVATRPDFDAPSDASAKSTNANASKPVPSSKQATESLTPKKDESSLCANREACARAGLIGACCPTAEGVLLECCNA